MLLATSTGGTILITVVAFLILLMVLVALLAVYQGKTVAFRAGYHYDQWGEKNGSGIGQLATFHFGK